MTCYFNADAIHQEYTAVENMFIIEHMPYANAAQLRAYLYGLMLCRYPQYKNQSLEEALQMSTKELVEAFSYWQREGLVFVRSTEPLRVEYALVPHARPVSALLPGKHFTLVQAAQALFAPRTLRDRELRTLYDWVDVFGLTEQVALELLSYGLIRKGEHVSMKYMDRIAEAWAMAGIKTVEDAKAQIAAHESKTGGAYKILLRWSKKRPATQDEQRLYEKWTREWGYSEEAVLAACPALTNADKPSFKYLDAVLSSLRESGVYTPEDIAASFHMDEEERETAGAVFKALGLSRGSKISERREIQSYLHDGLPMEVILQAAKKSADKERPFPALKRLLKEYVSNGIVTLEQAEAYEAPEPLKKQKQTGALDYEQRAYTDKELEHIYINLDD